MAGRKQVVRTATPKEASTRSPKRALEAGATESPTKKAKVAHNGHLPSHPSPPQFWHPAPSATQLQMQQQQQQMVGSGMAIQANWRMPINNNKIMVTNNQQAYPGQSARLFQPNGLPNNNNIMMSNNQQAYSALPVRMFQPSGASPRAEQPLDTQIAEVNAAIINLQEEKNDNDETMDVDGEADNTMNLGEEADDEMEVDEEDEDVDWDDQAATVMASVRHSLANPQPLVLSDWNQRAVNKNIKRAQRFAAGYYR